MLVVYALTEQAPGDNGEPVKIGVKGDKTYLMVHRPLAADPDHMFRLLSSYATKHMREEWMHIGSTVDRA